jgi:hypothetical protein
MTGLAAGRSGPAGSESDPGPHALPSEHTQCCQRQPGSLRGLGKFIARWQLTLPVGVDRSQAALIMMVALERPATVTGTPTQVSLRSGQILKV